MNSRPSHRGGQIHFLICRVGIWVPFGHKMKYLKGKIPKMIPSLRHRSSKLSPIREKWLKQTQLCFLHCITIIICKLNQLSYFKRLEVSHPNKINELVLLCTAAAVYCCCVRHIFYIDFNCQLLSHLPRQDANFFCLRQSLSSMSGLETTKGKK